MRVLEIMGSLYRGGAETMIMNYYRAFDKDKCQMDFIIHAEFENDYRDEARGLGANIFLLSRPGEIGILKYIHQVEKILKTKGPYDAVHIHTNYQAFLSVIAAKKCNLNNIIVHSHTAHFKFFEKIINRFFFKLYHTKNLSCGVLAGDAFFGKQHYRILNNAIDISKFRHVDLNEIHAKKNQLYGQMKIIGHLGSFTYPKNHDFIIKLAKRLKGDRLDFKILLFGEGKLIDEFINKVRSEHLEEYVEFSGVTATPEKIYRLFDIFILPSLYEGFPVTLVEAQLSGVYSLASDQISHECIINKERIEFLPLDVDYWAEKIKLILKQNLDYEDEIGADDFDVNIQWRKLYNIYCDK